MFRVRTLVLCSPIVLLIAMTAVPSGPSAAAPSATAVSKAVVSTLPSVTPGLAQAGEVVGAVSPSTTIDFSVMVKGRNDAALFSLAKAVSDPSSPLFRHFLSRAQMLAQVDPPQAWTDAVVAGMSKLGIGVVRVSSDGRMIDAQAPAGILSSQLGIRFAYMKSGHAALQRVALNQPLFPAAISPLIGDVIGLSATPATNFATGGPVTITNAPAPAYFNARPCSTSYGQALATAQPSYLGSAQPYTICGYSPDQVRAAYRVPQTGLTGAGVRIGIVDDYSSPTMVADANQYSQLHGLPPLGPGQYVDHSDLFSQKSPEIVINTPPSVLGPVPGESPQEWSGEQSLDVEMVHTMAPQATIEYYGGDQGLGLQPLEAEFSIAIADDQAQFITDSWGVGETNLLVTPGDFHWMDLALALGALEGIGASFSTGDAGDNIEMNDVKSADFPASDAMGTAVGGTTLVVGTNNLYVGETYWGTRLEPLTPNGKGWNPTPVSTGTGPATGPGSLAGAGGGGVSNQYPEPDWQKSIVPPSLTTQRYTSPDKANTNNVNSPGRVTPDISLVADSTTGVLVGQTQTDVDGVARYSEFRIGGTSVSSPLFGGMMALAIQWNGGKSLGFISPAMYAAYIKSPSGFRHPYDHTPYNVRTDYKNTQDPSSPVVYHLRLLGQLSSLHWLSGYDDSTGLGTPCATAFIAAIVAPTVAIGSGPGCGEPLSRPAHGTAVTSPTATPSS
ncbi:MAG TPA: S53 family peptidase [Acidimicrobiales bacterium]|nr:S53 family peptidase [Acidimicrobiales bacterium]